MAVPVSLVIPPAAVDGREDLAAVPSWYARAGRDVGRRGAAAGRRCWVGAGAGVARAGVLLWRDPLGPHAPGPAATTAPAVGCGPAWVESWAYPARPDRNPNESGGFSLYSCYRCLDAGTGPYRSAHLFQIGGGSGDPPVRTVINITLPTTFRNGPLDCGSCARHVAR